MYRRQFVQQASGAMAATLIASSKTASAAIDKQRPVAKPMPIELDKELAIDVRSSGVRWRDAMIHLVQFHTARFLFDSEPNHLTATFTGQIQTFDEVQYDVNVAVFGERGALLGATRNSVKVRRVWAGRYGTQSAKIELHFGISRDFDQGLSFLASISNRTVLTPDQWNKRD